MTQPEQFPHQIELTVIPIPPDTVASVKAELEGEVEAALRESGHGNLWADNQVQVEVEQTFPTDAAVIVALTLLSNLALEVFKATVLPRLKKRFEVRQRKSRSRNKKTQPARK